MRRLITPGRSKLAMRRPNLYRYPRVAQVPLTDDGNGVVVMAMSTVKRILSSSPLSSSAPLLMRRLSPMSASASASLPTRRTRGSSRARATWHDWRRVAQHAPAAAGEQRAVTGSCDGAAVGSRSRPGSPGAFSAGWARRSKRHRLARPWGGAA